MKPGYSWLCGRAEPSSSSTRFTSPCRSYQASAASSSSAISRPAPARRWRPGRGRCGRGSPARSGGRRSRRPACRRGRGPGRGSRPGPASALTPLQLRHAAAPPRRRRSGGWRRGGSRCRPARQCLATIRQVPGQASVSPRSRRADPAQLVGVAGRGHQRARPDQDVAARSCGSGGRRGTAARARGPGRRWRGPAPPRRRQLQVAAAEGDDARVGWARRRRPRGGPTRGRRRRPPAPATVVPRGWRMAIRSPPGSARDRPLCPSGSCRRPAARPRRRPRRRRRSRPPRWPASAGPRRPRAWGSISAISSPPSRRRPGTPFAMPAPFELVEAPEFALVGGDHQLARALIGDLRARRSTHRARARPRRRGAPSASPARSRCRRG